MSYSDKHLHLLLNYLNVLFLSELDTMYVIILDEDTFKRHGVVIC